MTGGFGYTPAEHAETVQDALLTSLSLTGDVYPHEQYDAALAALDRLVARVAEAEKARDEQYERYLAVESRAIFHDDAMARAAEAEKALALVAEQQPKTLETLRSNGIVFDGPLGNDPSNWQHVAFTIYTDLCEVDSIARTALYDRAAGGGAVQTGEDG